MARAPQPLNLMTGAPSLEPTSESVGDNASQSQQSYAAEVVSIARARALLSLISITGRK